MDVGSFLALVVFAIFIYGIVSFVKKQKGSRKSIEDVTTKKK